jgi:ankyrin repeat protein
VENLTYCLLSLTDGAIPLLYAIGSHAACGGSKHADLAIRFLLEHGADTIVSDSHGHTVLHITAYRSVAGEPINTALLDLLVSHGASANHADNDRNKTLHIMVMNYTRRRWEKFYSVEVLASMPGMSRGAGPFMK